MHKLTVIILTINLSLLGWLSPLWSFEKVGVTAFQFLKVTPDARAAALGDAYSAIARGADGLYWNPAAMLLGGRLSLNISYVNYIFDTRHSSLAACYQYHQYAFGLLASSVSYGEIQVTDVAHLGFLPDGTYNPGLTGEIINPGAWVIGASFAQYLTNKFAYGLTFKYGCEDMGMGDSTRQQIQMWDFGIVYNTGFRSIRLAATLRHFGPQVKYFDYAYPLPQTMQIGIAADLIGPQVALLGTNSLHHLLVSCELIQPRDYDQQYGIGAEYTLADLLTLRAGYKINYDTEGLTLGGGIRWKNIILDYAYSDYGRYLLGVHRFSVNLNY